MHTELYLDTARFGRTCPTAVRAEQDFATLVSQLGSSLYFEQFLVEGFSALPDVYQVDCPALECWSGIHILKQDFARFVNAPDYAVAFFSQSSSLIESAVNGLLQNANTILTTDLAWPPYVKILTRRAKAANKSVAVCPIRDAWLYGRESKAQLTARLRADYLKHQCDGLFLSSISYLGYAQPIAELLQSIPSASQPNFFVVDAAQSLGQKPLDMQLLNCDMLIGGTQKWMQAGRPLRVAITRPGIANDIAHDALHHFTRNPTSIPHGETIDPGCLITAAATLSELTAEELMKRWHLRKANHQRLTNTDVQDVDSAIAVTQCKSNIPTRAQLFETGIIASVFDNIVRFSMPAEPLPTVDLSRIREIGTDR